MAQNYSIANPSPVQLEEALYPLQSVTGPNKDGCNQTEASQLYSWEFLLYQETLIPYNHF